MAEWRRAVGLLAPFTCVTFSRRHGATEERTDLAFCCLQETPDGRGGGEAGRRCGSHLHVYSSAAGKVQLLFVCIWRKCPIINPVVSSQTLSVCSSWAHTLSSPRTHTRHLCTGLVSVQWAACEHGSYVIGQVWSHLGFNDSCVCVCVCDGKRRSVARAMITHMHAYTHTHTRLTHDSKMHRMRQHLPYGKHTNSSIRNMLFPC